MKKLDEIRNLEKCLKKHNLEAQYQLYSTEIERLKNEEKGKFCSLSFRLFSLPYV
jgi:hypothetical protein